MEELRETSCAFAPSRCSLWRIVRLSQFKLKGYQPLDNLNTSGEVEDEPLVRTLRKCASVQELRSFDSDTSADASEKVTEDTSPRGVLEGLDVALTCSVSDTGSSRASTAYLEVQEHRSTRVPWRLFLQRWSSKSVKRLYSYPRLGIPKVLRQTLSKVYKFERADSCPDSACRPSWKNFSLAELQAATNNFSAEFCCEVSYTPYAGENEESELSNQTEEFQISADTSVMPADITQNVIKDIHMVSASFTLADVNLPAENIIGRGGYAEVYKGCLEDGHYVAIKRLIRGTSDEDTTNFLSELGIIVHVDHPNSCKLIGFGIEGGLFLVLQLSEHGSLSSFLYGPNEKLDWSTRYRVAIGTAKGLEYLHERCPRRIIHRDIKASNILLSKDFEPQISDFGLAKWLPDKLTHYTMSSFEGTFGYLAPEYLMHGTVNEKVDVFAYGVLLLELITGRKAIDSSKQSLVIWAKPLLERKKIAQLIDPSLGDAYDFTELSRATNTAYLCIQQSSILRPRMSQVVRLLHGEEGRSEQTIKGRHKTLQRTYSEELFDAEEYNATRYLNDLRQLKKLALDF